MLDVLTHTVCAIIEAEAAGTPDAAAAAAQGADLAGAAAGVMHNLLHPALRAWNTRAQHQAGAYTRPFSAQPEPFLTQHAS